ncbi:MAG: hypothetical protein ACRCSI_11485 [Eubacterium aggregans]
MDGKWETENKRDTEGKRGAKDKKSQGYAIVESGKIGCIGEK